MRSLCLILCLLCLSASRKPVPTQGDAAAQQAAGAKLSFKLAAIAALPPPPMPSAVVPPSTNLPGVYFFATTAKDTNGLTSVNSIEVTFTNTTKTTRVMALFGASISPGVTNNTVLKGRAADTLTNSYSAGTNLSLTVPLPPPTLTNCVVTLTGLGTNWASTNPPGFHLFRGTNLSISKRYQ